MLALVTGGSAGIGVELARELAKRKCDLILAARSADALRSVADDLASAHAITTHVVVCDLATPGAAERLAREAMAIGRIDILVNNAGFGAFGEFADQPLDAQMSMLRVNVDALTELTWRVLPHLIESRGKILNVASTAAFQPGPLMAVYYATKAYVLSFSEAIAEELAARGVTVTCLCPGPTRSGFQERAGVEETRLVKLGMMAADRVARAGIAGLFAGRRIVVPGLTNRLGAQLPRVSPRRATTRVVRWIQDKKR
jgi:uncharacterized protein